MDRKKLELRLLVFLCIPAGLIFLLNLRRSAVCEQHHKEWVSFLDGNYFKSLEKLAKNGDTKEFDTAVAEFDTAMDRLKSFEPKMWRCMYNPDTGRIE